MFWKVEFEPIVHLQLKKAYDSGVLGREDTLIIRKWIRQIEMHGPEFIQSHIMWSDHPLNREWSGYRSSCFSRKGRIIYRIENNRVIVRVVRITLDHDYNKGE